MKPSAWKILAYRASLVLLIVLAWYSLTEWKQAAAALSFSQDDAAFFFGQPSKVAERLYAWFATGEIVEHLVVTLIETVLAFAIGTSTGLFLGLLFALNPMASAVMEPFITALNAMPRVILAPIFAVWFGLGMASKVVFGTTLVFFIVFFNVYHGTREVAPAVLANARVLGASKRSMLWHVYIPSATSWVFSSLHTSIGMAFVGAVVGEYLGSARGVGYLIQQAEGVFDINTVVAGIVLLTACALILDYAVTRAERALLVWRPEAGHR